MTPTDDLQFLREFTDPAGVSPRIAHAVKTAKALRPILHRDVQATFTLSTSELRAVVERALAAGVQVGHAAHGDDDEGNTEPGW